MSNGKKKKQANKAATKPASQGNSVNKTLAVVDELAIDHPQTGKLDELAKTAQQSLAAGGAEKVSQTLIKDIENLAGELRQQLDMAHQASKEQANTLAEAQALEAQAKSQQTELEADQKKLAASQKKMAVDKADLANRLDDLSERERDADNGFGNRKLQMLDEIEQKKKQLEDKWQAKKQAVEAEIADLLDDKAGLIEAQNQQYQEKTDALIEEKDKLDQMAFALKSKDRKLTLRETQVEMTAAEAQEYKSELREVVGNEYLQQVSSLEAQNENLSVQIEQYQQQEQQYLVQISAFKEIERQFDGLTASQFMDQYRVNKTRLQDMQDQLDAKPDDELESLYQQLKQDHEQLQQIDYDKQTELSEVKTQLHKNRLSVIELEQQHKQKQVIEKHNQLLQAKLDSLSADVDDLQGRQKGLCAFPALLELDSKNQNKALVNEIPDLKSFVGELQQRIAWDQQEQKALYYQETDIQLFIAGLAMSRLFILQGISGTGKTSLAKAFARAMDGGCTTVSVQAGWRNKEDFIGHYNAFEKKFYEHEALQGLYEAQTPFYADRPYIILLDEVNLSQPEHYFAEFLSVLEQVQKKDRKLTLMTTTQHNGPEQLIDGKTLKIPDNVWFIGTANHDETTFEFADKTYDRAHVMTLPRHHVDFKINKKLDNVTYSYSSLAEAFDKAEEKYKSKVGRLIKALNKSDMATCLANDFNVGWGNRLERQMLRFIPVMLACGSTLGFAVDHLLATKVLRAGKTTDRYDTQREDVELLKSELEDFWIEQKLDGQPSNSLALLDKELKKKGEQ